MIRGVKTYLIILMMIEVFNDVRRSKCRRDLKNYVFARIYMRSIIDVIKRKKKEC